MPAKNSPTRIRQKPAPKGLLDNLEATSGEERAALGPAKPQALINGDVALRDAEARDDAGGGLRSERDGEERQDDEENERRKEGEPERGEHGVEA